MAGTRKSARMSERRHLEEEDEERKRENDRKRQRTLFQRKDNVIRKNDMLVDTRLGKIVLGPEEVSEDVKVKVEANDEEAMEQLDHSEFYEEEREGAVVIIPTTTGQAVEDPEDSRQETEDNYGTAVSDSQEVHVKQEVNASPNTTLTNEQLEAKVTSLTLELEGMKHLVQEQNQKIIQLSTEMETGETKEQEIISQFMRELKSVRLEMECEKKEMDRRFEEHERATKAELEVLKTENRRLEASVNQLTGEVDAVKRKSKEEINLSCQVNDLPEAPNPVAALTISDSKSEGSPLQDHSEDMIIMSSESNENKGNGTNGENADVPQFPDVRATRTPLTIDPDLEAVLSRILRHIEKDFQTLQTFRLVSRTWNHVSLTTWRKLAVIKLLPDDETAQDTKGIMASEFFCEYQDDQSPFELADKPYSRWNLNSFSIDEIQDWDQTWPSIGPLMKYVHFQDCEIANMTSDAFPKLLIDKMPNLKKLALTSVEYDIFKEADTKVPLLDRNHSHLKSLVISGKVKIYLERLLVSLPNLESIEVTNDDKGKIVFDDTLDKISQAKILNPASLPNLKHLDLMNTFTLLRMLKDSDRHRFPQKLDRLVRANLQLKSFAMTFVPISKIGEPNIDPFLASQANTLQVLKLFQVPMNGNEFSTFLCQVQMTALKEIYLWGCVTEGLDFLKYTPNLKILYVNLTCLEKRGRMKQAINLFRNNAEYEKFEEDMVETVKDVMEDVVVERLETLHIDYEFPEKSLRTLAKWVPNLKVLKTIVSWSNVSAVVEEWSELEELTCLFESKIRDWSICKDDTRSRRKKGAVISDLKNLQHFQLDCLCDASNLTDASVFNGFLKMPSLKSVQICVSKQFSDEAEEALKRGVENCRVIRNYTGGDHSNYDCCQRREFDLEVSATGLHDKAKDNEEESESEDSDEGEEDVDSA